MDLCFQEIQFCFEILFFLFFHQLLVLYPVFRKFNTGRKTGKIKKAASFERTGF